jgi:hypothetical protein
MSDCSGIVNADTGNSIISECSNAGTMAGTGCAGIIKQLNKTIVQRCKNTGDMTTTCGGIGFFDGSNYPSSAISECFNRGNITGARSAGIINDAGKMRIDNCYNSGILVLGSFGIVMVSNGTYLSNCYVSSHQIPNQDPLAPATLTVIYRKNCSDERAANGHWSDRRADKYLIGPDGTVWLKNNGKPYKLAKLV